VQIGWLTGSRLATVSVTSLRGDRRWAIDSVLSIALRADEHLAPTPGHVPGVPPRRGHLSHSIALEQVRKWRRARP
jgi:hypothetical protein